MYVVKDLVPDMNNFYDQYKSVQPWLQLKETTEHTYAERQDGLKVFNETYPRSPKEVFSPRATKNAFHAAIRRGMRHTSRSRTGESEFVKRGSAQSATHEPRHPTA